MKAPKRESEGVNKPDAEQHFTMQVFVSAEMAIEFCLLRREQQLGRGVGP